MRVPPTPSKRRRRQGARRRCKGRNNGRGDGLGGAAHSPTLPTLRFSPLPPPPAGGCHPPLRCSHRHPESRGPPPVCCMRGGAPGATLLWPLPPRLTRWKREDLVAWPSPPAPRSRPLAAAAAAPSAATMPAARLRRGGRASVGGSFSPLALLIQHARPFIPLQPGTPPACPLRYAGPSRADATDQQALWRGGGDARGTHWWHSCASRPLPFPALTTPRGRPPNLAPPSPGVRVGRRNLFRP